MSSDEVGRRKDSKDVLRLFGHVKRMKNDRFGKRVYVGECAGSRSATEEMD